MQLEGKGFAVQMKFDSRKVTPEIDFNEVTDSKLKRYWPGGITRIVFTVNNPKIKGKNEIVITEAKK